MSAKPSPAEFLVLSRGRWDKDLPPERIQKAIDEFYIWLHDSIAAGKMKMGQRLATDARVVTKRLITDGPFIETREVIGGYWFILADTLDEAAEIAAGNPCLACGLEYEIRPIETVKASAYAKTNETPD